MDFTTTTKLFHFLSITLGVIEVHSRVFIVFPFFVDTEKEKESEWRKKSLFMTLPSLLLLLVMTFRSVSLSVVSRCCSCFLLRVLRRHFGSHVSHTVFVAYCLVLCHLESRIHKRPKPKEGREWNCVSKTTENSSLAPLSFKITFNSSLSFPSSSVFLSRRRLVFPKVSSLPVLLVSC